MLEPRGRDWQYLGACPRGSSTVTLSLPVCLDCVYCCACNTIWQQSDEERTTNEEMVFERIGNLVNGAFLPKSDSMPLLNY